MKTIGAPLLALLLCSTAIAEEPSFGYRELSQCQKVEETAWRPAKLKVALQPKATVIEVDSLFNCAHSPKSPTVLYSPVSTTLAVEEGGLFGAMCLCKHLLEFKLPRRLALGTTVYFSVEGKVYGHAAVR